jgi:hypothetical protein
MSSREYPMLLLIRPAEVVLLQQVLEEQQDPPVFAILA